MRELRPPTSDERAIISKLLESDFPGRDKLLEQLNGLMVQEIDQQGSLALIVCVPTRSDIREHQQWHVPIDAEYFDNDTLNSLSDPKVHILLHVKEGKLHELEFYKDDGSEILRKPNPENIEITVMPLRTFRSKA